MADIESTPAAVEPSKSRLKWLPVAAILAAVIGVLAIQSVQIDGLDSGMRMMFSVLLIVASFIVVIGWFLLLSAASARARMLVAAVLALGFIAAAASVRRVEYSGDMIPTFDFRWSPDRTAVLEAHRAQQGAGQGSEADQTPVPTEVGQYDVQEYRGPLRDGIVKGPKLARDWKANPPKQVWRQPVGGGYASFVVIGPTIATIEQRRDKEAIVAYDADTGRQRWVHEYPALFSETLGGDGPRATPTFHEGKLYALGATGVFTCLDFATGKPNWSFNILEQNKSGNIDWGMSGSPLVYDDLVLVNPGNQKGTPESRSIMAVGLSDGKLRWSSGKTLASYASPMLVTLAGTRQVLIFDGVGLAGYDAADGKELWSTPWKSDFNINAAQPFVLPGDQVLITSASGTALVQVQQSGGAWSAEELWKSRKLKGGYASPIVLGDYVYGIDENILACIELKSGKQMWKSRAGQFGHGQLLLSGDLLLILGEAGELALVEATPEAYKELGRIQAIEGKTWNVPVLVGPRIFVRNHLEMAAYDLPVEP